MRALAISDLHFGAWTGDPVLSRDFARERLAPLGNQNPLDGATRATGDFRAGVADQFSARVRAYDATLPAQAGA